MNIFRIHQGKKLISNISRVTIEVILVFMTLIIIGLINKNFFFFSDTIYYSIAYPDNSTVIDPLTPLLDKSVLGDVDGEVVQIPNQLITSALTEFTIKVPEGFSKDFSTAKVSLDFHPGKVNEIMFGPQIVSSGDFSYFPIYNKALEDLTWNKISDGEHTLWQRQRVYSSINDFFTNPPGGVIPSLEEQLTNSFAMQTSQYYFDQMELVEDKFLPNISNIGASIPLMEGNLTSYTYVPERGLLSVNVTKHDVNYLVGADQVDIFIYNSKGELMSNEVIGDDGSIVAGGTIGPKQSKDITLPDINPGMYKIQVVASDSLVSISVNQPYLVVEDAFYLSDNVINKAEAPYTIYTDATSVNIPTWHVGSSNQMLTIDGNKQVYLNDSRIGQNNITINLATNDQTLHEIQLEKNHLAMVDANTRLSRYFSFSKEAFFNPTPLKLKTLDLESDFSDNSGINFLISKYQSPEKIENHYQGNYEFDLSIDGHILDNKITFSIYIPEREGLKEGVKINSIEVVLQK